MKRIILLIAALVLPFFAFAKPSDKPSQLTVISYNLRLGTANDGTNSWVYRAPATLLMIEDQMPDIIGLQDALTYQVKALVEYSKDYEAAALNKKEDGKMGRNLPVMYNIRTMKALKWATVDISESETATWILFLHKASGKSFYFINTKVAGTSDAVKKIKEEIGKVGKDGLDMIIGGDFGTVEEHLNIEGENLKSARGTAVKTDLSLTYHNWGKIKDGKGSDHIFYNISGTCSVFEVIKESYDNRKYISDHYPVKAVFLL